MRIRSYKVALSVGLWLLLGAVTVLVGSAQVRAGWSEPQQLSTPGNKASEATLVSDQYGFVHVFWAEIVGDTRSILQYTRYDGNVWSRPVDLFGASAATPIKAPSAFVDDEGTLHLMWTTNESGPFFYSTAPAHDALAAGRWSTPRRVDLEASRAELIVEANGTIHLVGTNATATGFDPGVYYMRSSDQGVTWSNQQWLDPDILAGHYPASLQFAIDEDGGLHAVWFYISLSGEGADWVRYARSLDGGDTWVQPSTIARNEANDVVVSSAASPVMEVQERTVMVVWAGSDLKRRYRYSTDRGETWSPALRFFGDLEGQAFEGMAVDGEGRIHYFAQLRYPQAIYHGYWDGERWSRPELIFFISSGSSDPLDETDIHAHHTHPAVRAGNELLLTFADSPPEPDRRLFVIRRTLDDVTPSPVQPTPAAIAHAQVEATPTEMPTETPTVLEEEPVAVTAPGNNSATQGNELSQGAPALIGIIPVLILLGVTGAYQLFRKLR